MYRRAAKLCYTDAPLAFLKRWIAEEEIVAASGWSLLASVRLEHGAESALHLINLIENGEYSLLHHLVWILCT